MLGSEQSENCVVVLCSRNQIRMQLNSPHFIIADSKRPRAVVVVVVVVVVNLAVAAALVPLSARLVHLYQVRPLAN